MTRNEGKEDKKLTNNYENCAKKNSFYCDFMLSSLRIFSCDAREETENRYRLL
jgi:hypothetical protein